jgi:GNAT superfamily N-acetyltransferase
VGVARYLRDPRDPLTGRFAVAVADEWQGAGLGPVLLERIAARARADGVEALSGSTVAGNRAARRLGATSSLDARSGTLQLTIRPAFQNDRAGAHAPQSDLPSILEPTPAPAA